MQELKDKNYVQESQDLYMLQYLLKQPDMLSTTGFKVLQGQESAGLIPCYRVIYNGLDKLDYDIENYTSLQVLAQSANANTFLNYVKNVFAIVLNLKSIGFLHPYNLETTLDKIFVDTKANSVHLVYLPMQETYLPQMNTQYLQVLKAALQKVLTENPNLQNPLLAQLLPLLTEPSSSLEDLHQCLALLPPLIKINAEEQTQTISSGQTGVIAQTSGGLSSGNLATQQEHPANEAKEPKAQEEAKKAKPKKGFFGAKKPVAKQEDFQQNIGGTEVLCVFVPTIYLKGQGKTEILVDKHEFVLGRDDSADGTIDSSAISRKHCKILYSDEKNFILDLDSANGTYLNGTKLEANKPKPINEGDKIKLGNVGFIVMSV